MPIYEYGCTECGKHIEAFQKISEEPLTVCPDCGGELSKLISSTSFVLKGGGWYADGYASSDKKPEKKAPTADSGEKKTEAPKEKTPAPAKAEK